MPFAAVCPEFTAAAQNGLWCPSDCENGRGGMHLHSWAEIGGVQLSLAAGLQIVFCMQ